MIVNFKQSEGTTLIALIDAYLELNKDNKKIQPKYIEELTEIKHKLKNPIR